MNVSYIESEVFKASLAPWPHCKVFDFEILLLCVAAGTLVERKILLVVTFAVCIWRGSLLTNIGFGAAINAPCANGLNKIKWTWAISCRLTVYEHVCFSVFYLCPNTEHPKIQKLLQIPLICRVTTTDTAISQCRLAVFAGFWNPHSQFIPNTLPY
jgi:hypothetical protein